MRRIATTVLVLALLVPPAAAQQPEPPWVDPPAHDLASPYVASPGPQIPSTHLNYPYGGTHDQTGRRDFLERVHRSGVRWVYVWIVWSEVEPLPGQYQWANLDRFLVTAEDVGINVIAQVHVGAWSQPQAWAGVPRTNSRHPESRPAAYEDFSAARDFWVALVRRYAPGGELAQAQGWDRYGVRWWEVENEPDQTPGAWWGSWAAIPKDYAAFLAAVVPAVKAVAPEVTIAAPALNHEDEPSIVRGGGVAGIAWLDEMLAPGGPDSEWATDTYRSQGPYVDPVPLIDVFSFHRNNVDVSRAEAAVRAGQVRAVAERHLARHPGREARLYYSEGNALQYDPDETKYARAQVQLAVQTLAAGAEKIAFDHGSHINDAEWETNRMFLAARAMTTFFPRPGNVASADEDVDAQRVTAFRRTEPGTGRRTYVVWAHDLARGSTEGPGEAFEVAVPVRSERALVVGPDFATREVVPTDGAVAVRLWRDDPSPVVFVHEAGALPAPR